MPNWATVTRKIYGSKENLKTIEDAIVKCETSEKPLVENGFGKLWLGCLVAAMGGDWEKVRCRGEITSYCMNEDHLCIESWEAWGEQAETRHFLEQCFADEDGESSISIFYYCSEPGMCEYYTNDPDCEGMQIDVWTLDEDGEENDLVESYEADNTDDALSFFDNAFPDIDFEGIETLEGVEENMKEKGYKVVINEYEYMED